MQMIYIPAGSFWMGAVPGDAQAHDFERPRHRVYLDGFWIDATEVTVAMYSQCVLAGACSNRRCKASREEFGIIGQVVGNPRSKAIHNANSPATCVTWQQAIDYCAWRGARLPSEAEWEKAARGGLEGQIYPWGHAVPDGSLANFEIPEGNYLAPVGSYPPNGFGIYDMAGNAWEWVNDWFDYGSFNYYAISPAANPTGPESGTYRVSRGGAYCYKRQELRASNRVGGDPDYQLPFVGFRCAR